MKRIRNSSRFIVTITFLYFLIFISLPVFAQEIEKGVKYREIIKPDIPWAIQVLEIDRDRKDIKLQTALGGEYVLGIEPLNKIMERIEDESERPVAAVNGDFYILRQDPFRGDPIGLFIQEGEIISSPVNRSVFVIRENGELIIDRFRFVSKLSDETGKKTSLSGVNQRCPENGTVILTSKFYSETRPQKGSFQILAGPVDEPLTPNRQYKFVVQEMLLEDSVLSIPESTAAFVGLGTGAEFLKNFQVGDEIKVSIGLSFITGNIDHAIGGTPRLLRGGEISIEWQEEKVSESFVTTRHPRTAVGFNKDKIFLVTVDGRQPGYSAGMSLQELAEFMKELGAEEAMNLDGGGSTTMWVDGEIRNRPSGGAVRPVANALIVVKKK
ncbi:phosphodiester glycosidase family protein [candidate division KSB1 bacterium]